MYLDSDKTVWIEKHHIDPDKNFYNFNEFCKMIYNGFEELKKRGALSHKQYVSKTEYQECEFLSGDDRWELVNDDENVVLIECDIDDAAKCIIEAFVGQRLG